MKNILVFPCGSEIGLDIYSSVKYSTHFHLIGANSIDDHGVFVYDDYIPGLPFVSDPLFIPALRQIVLDRKIDAIYPTMDSVISTLKAHEKDLGCMVISSPAETTMICLSKSRTYQSLRDTLRVPEQYQPDRVTKFPVFVKPDEGYGSRGVALVNDSTALQQVLSANPKLLILEYLPGKEYTVDCFTDRKGKLLYAAARERNRIKGGISVNTSFSEEQEEFIELAQKINQKIIFRGAWFYQVKRAADKGLCLMEIASRLGGSSLLSRAVGVNLALMTLFDAFNIDVSVQKNNSYRVELDRALDSRYHCDNLNYDYVYVDFDDCLITHKTSVNTELVRFLYECLNKEKRVILLTKHIGDLKADLDRFRLNQLFDEIILIRSNQEKTDFINYTNAIFIDDSFTEREKVKKAFGIPVFGPEMADLLSDSIQSS